LTSSSTAINTLYREILGKNTKFSGPAIMGLYNEQIVAKLIQDVTFFPIYIQLQSFLIVVSNIGYSKNNGCHAGNGFISSLQTKFQGKYSLVSQQIKNNMYILEFYYGSLEIIAMYEDTTPAGV